MIKKLLELLYKALEKMVGYKSITDAFDLNDSIISDKMSDSMELWKAMYKDESPWLDESAGIYSLGLAKQICQSLQQQTLSEMETSISAPGETEEVEEDKDKVIDTKAKFLNDVYKKRFIKNLPQAFEKGLALGGMIVKPYINNTQLYLDFVFQGEFYPISFDDDGNIIDIAFFDQFTMGKYIFTKVERQTFSPLTNQVVIENKAFKAQIKGNDEEQDLGTEIPLTDVERWKGLSIEPVIINTVNKPLYGFFKAPLANNIDLKSPLGISIFSPAISLIQRADEQFSRLDWEYKGGQLAIDVDPTAITYSEGYYGKVMDLDDVQNRLYRKLDMGQDDTYNAWAPVLRDANYINGLNIYTNKIEDMLGLARGTLSQSQVESEARTATEIKLLKQRTYVTISALQDNLEKCILDTVYAMDVFTELYNLAPSGEYHTNIEWKDSILTDTDTELEQKLNLQNAGILSKAEIRAWYTGESLEEAEIKIDEMEQKSQANMLNDLFTSQATNNENTLESDENKDINTNNNGTEK